MTIKQRCKVFRPSHVSTTQREEKSKRAKVCEAGNHFAFCLLPVTGCILDVVQHTEGIIQIVNRSPGSRFSTCTSDERNANITLHLFRFNEGSGCKDVCRIVGKAPVPIQYSLIKVILIGQLHTSFLVQSVLPIRVKARKRLNIPIILFQHIGRSFTFTRSNSMSSVVIILMTQFRVIVREACRLVVVERPLPDRIFCHVFFLFFVIFLFLLLIIIISSSSSSSSMTIISSITSSSSITMCGTNTIRRNSHLFNMEVNVSNVIFTVFITNISSHLRIIVDCNRNTFISTLQVTCFT